jgi:AraC-like DNA-binding protein
MRKFESLSEAHEAFGLPKPLHPLISVVRGLPQPLVEDGVVQSHVLGFYKISYKPKQSGRLRYGRDYYDFNEGGLLFASPHQIIGGGGEDEGQGAPCSLFHTLLIHPDFFLGYPLAKKIRQYGFFSYSANEALHLSEPEKETILGIFRMIEAELSSRIDELSQDVVISQIELLLSYANRYYKRQFITRKAVNNELLQRMEELLEKYFGDEISLNKGIPTVQYLAGELHLSPSYLSDLLRSLLGQNAQQYIHDKLIEKAKEKLSTTDLTVSEVAYTLGFEHSQSFSKLFKKKTNLSPLEFRRGFN